MRGSASVPQSRRLCAGTALQTGVKPTGDQMFSFCKHLRAHAWHKALANGKFQSIDNLAATTKWNSKVTREALRLAFLAPGVVESIFNATQPRDLNLLQLQKITSYCWHEQIRSMSGN